MSELKVYMMPLKTNMFGEPIVSQSYYLKSEADKVIAELKKQVHDYAQGLYVMQARAEKEARHDKYKRCLAMAEWCKAMCGHYLSYEEPEWFWFRKWSERWIKIAEKFKPNNEVNNG